MEEMPRRFDFPKTFAAWMGGDDLDDALWEELEAVAIELAEEACAYSGGWPEDAAVVSCQAREVAGYLRIDARISFTELRPSACKDAPYTEQRETTEVLTMLPGDSIVICGWLPGDDDQLDLADWNSANDGM